MAIEFLSLDLGCGDFILTNSIAFFYSLGLTSIVTLQFDAWFCLLKSCNWKKYHVYYILYQYKYGTMANLCGCCREGCGMTVKGNKENRAEHPSSQEKTNSIKKRGERFMRKRIVSFILFLAMLVSLFPSTFVLQASAATDSGTCGENLTWELDTATGSLTITGSGAMSDYDSGEAPWYQYFSSIKTVSIESGVTSIGVSAFSGCSSLTGITILNPGCSITAAALPRLALPG